ncbi:unnamed protein product [Mytilus coruscus]|uniref:Retropepsins domain-containing protein n=1 Tax=Mytilus coruscus TaxID=42192 RepID=A0A6J8CVI4_MYTCO|nr:unnamed protein product [Mytilus coruscus]
MGKQEKKVCRLLDCFADVALEYARKVNTDDDSKALRKTLKQRFSKKDDQTRLEPKHSSEDIKTLKQLINLNSQPDGDIWIRKIQSKSKRNPNNGVFKQQRVGPVGQRSTPKSIGHETSPHDKTKQRPTSSFDIVIRRTIGKSLAVQGTIYDQNVSMIVDNAAMITLVNEKLIPADNEDSETVTLRGLGEQLVTGKIIKNTSLDIDRVNIQWDVCKAALTDDVILGLDNLDTLGAVINLSTPTLTINNKVINAAFVNSGGEISIQHVCIKRTITVSPNSEITITIKTNKSADHEFILEPCPLTSCVLVSHVVGKGNSCPLSILNDGNRHIRLKKGTPIGYIE